MFEGELVIFDLETTGLSPHADDIIQIAAVRMVKGLICPADTFFSYVDPGRRIPPFITQYTGITNWDVQGAPDVGSVLRSFSEYVGNATLVAHNGHRFDMPFLAASCHKKSLSVRAVPYHDSLALSWQFWGRRGFRHGLDQVLSRLNIVEANVRRHDARGDVILLAKAVEKLWEQILATQGPPQIKLYHGSLPMLAGTL